jgi:hypothetical protein
MQYIKFVRKITRLAIDLEYENYIVYIYIIKLESEFIHLYWKVLHNTSYIIQGNMTSQVGIKNHHISYKKSTIFTLLWATHYPYNNLFVWIVSSTPMQCSLQWLSIWMSFNYHSNTLQEMYRTCNHVA